VKTNEQLSDELADLRNQLLDYHQRLEQALEHNTKFQLKATWGIVHSLLIYGTWIGASLALSKLWHWVTQETVPWWGFVIISFASIFAGGVAGYWSTKGQEGDEKKLHRWPEWKSR